MKVKKVLRAMPGMFIIRSTDYSSYLNSDITARSMMQQTWNGVGRRLAHAIAVVADNEQRPTARMNERQRKRQEFLNSTV